MKTIIDKVNKLITLSESVKVYHKKNLWDQLIEISKLTRDNPTCNVWDYYRLGIYRRDLSSRQTRREYLGYGANEEFNLALNSRSGVSAAWDKLLFELIACTYDIPTPHTVAVFKEQGDIPPHIPRHLRKLSDVESFLADSSNYPLFIKPVHSQQNIGGHLLQEYHENKALITLDEREQISTADLIARTINYTSDSRYNRESGYLFQKPIKQNKYLEEVTGTSAPSGFRIVVLNDGVSSPRAFCAVWKIVAPGNISDNFRSGTLGNLVASIDIRTGRVSGAIKGVWPNTEILEYIPNTGHELKPILIPEWNSIVELVEKFSCCFPTMKILHWDVALATSGPVILELNDLGGTCLLQLHDKGLLTDELVHFIKQNATIIRSPKLASFLRK